MCFSCTKLKLGALPKNNPAMVTKNKKQKKVQRSKTLYFQMLLFEMQ